MRKGVYKTILGVLLVCVLVVCELLLMRNLLNKRQEILLSQNGIIYASENRPSGTENENIQNTVLSAEELIKVVESLEIGGVGKLHEPTANQLTMKEAIEEGEKWLKLFYDELGFAFDDEAYSKIAAKLCEKPHVMDQSVLSDDYFSYWVIEYQGNDMEAVLYMNAVTAQVLWVKIITYPVDIDLMNANKGNVLRSYAESLQLDDDYFVKVGDDSAVLTFKNSGLYAFLEVYGVDTTYSNSTDETNAMYDVDVVAVTEHQSMIKMYLSADYE